MTEDVHQLERKLLDSYIRSLAEATERLEQAQQDVRRYQLAVRGLQAVMAEQGDDVRTVELELPVDLFRGSVPQGGDRAPTTRSEGPRGEEAVRQILRDNPGRPYTPRDLAVALDERGWISPGTKHPVESARAAANRLRRKDTEPVVYENGKYLWLPVARAPSADETANDRAVAVDSESSSATPATTQADRGAGADQPRQRNT